MRVRACRHVAASSAFAVAFACLALVTVLAAPALADNCDLRINPEDCQNTAWTIGAVAALAAAITAILVALSGLGGTSVAGGAGGGAGAVDLAERQKDLPEEMQGQEVEAGAFPVLPQEADDTCAIACVRMVFNRLTGKNVSEQGMARRSGALPGGYRNNAGAWGTNADAISTQMREIGLDAQTGRVSPEDMAKAIADGKQVIVLHKVKTWGHFVVVRDVRFDAAGTPTFVIDDPWTGKSTERSAQWWELNGRKEWTNVVGWKHPREGGAP